MTTPASPSDPDPSPAPPDAAPRPVRAAHADAAHADAAHADAAHADMAEAGIEQPPTAGPSRVAARPDGGTPSPALTRLSPRLLLIDPIRMLPSLLLPLAGLLVASGLSPVSFGWAGFGVAASMVYATIRWVTFGYRIAGDRLELSRSFISRSLRTIPLERIRGVDITTPPLHKILGLAVLKIDTGAGGEKQEGELDGVTMEEAERLRALLLNRPAAEPTAAEPGGRERTHVHARVPRQWLRFGPFSGAYLLTPFALVAGAVGLAFQWGNELGLSTRTAWRVGEWLWDRPLLLVVAAVLLVLAMPVVGGVMYAFFNWDFTLASRDGFLVAERGLIMRRVVSLERRRIRGYELADGLVERWLGLVRLWAVVTGLGDSETRGQLLPVAPRPYAVKVASEVIGPFTAPLREHPRAARRRRLFRAVAPWLAAAGVALVLQWGVVAFAALLLAVAGVPLGLDRYRSLGHAYDGVRLSVRSGSLRRTQAVVERRAVVGWTLRQTWFQRSSDLVTVIAGVGAGSGGYPAIDSGETQGVQFAAEVTPQWLEPFLATSDPPEEQS